MAKGYKPRRTKLKAHDQGRNRHSKGVAYLDKQSRLEKQHSGQVSRRRKNQG